MANSNQMVITVAQNDKFAVFTWAEDCKSCDYTSHGFDDSEIDVIIENKAYMGKDVEGYEVGIE